MACRPTPFLLRAAVAFVVCCSVASACPGAAVAEQRPKWEIGGGGVFYTQPDYVGSDEYRFHPIPFPWIVYRGERLRLDRESFQTRIFGTDLVRLDISGGGQISVDSNDNDRRHGMPDLDWIAQIGPTLRFAVLRSMDGRHSVDVDVPLRTAFAVDLHHFSYEGLVSSPKLEYRYEPDGWHFEGNAGLEFGSNDYNDYIYSVAARFATPERPRYGADGGYAGFRIAAGLGRYIGPFYVGVFTRYINLEGATFRDSPLVGSRSAFVGGIAIGWIWMKSKEMVPVGAEANLARRAAAAAHDEEAAAPDKDTAAPAADGGKTESP